MVDEILKFTKLTFLIAFIFFILNAVMMYLPEVTLPLMGFPTSPEINSLSITMGSIVLALAVSFLLVFLAKEWKQVKIVVITALLATLLDQINVFINFASVPLTFSIMDLTFGLPFLVLFLLTYLQQEDKIKPLWK
ncbi:MAG: hypothetical protein ACXABO_20500 [Promethearchaeota archaeon]|jgi:hypothetical protein